MSCTRRRKTKQPYCHDDPNCKWDSVTSRCKNKTIRQNENAQDPNKINRKLNSILDKLNKIEQTMSLLQKTQKNISPIHHNTFETTASNIGSWKNGNTASINPRDFLNKTKKKKTRKENTANSIGSWRGNNDNETASIAPENMF